MTEFTKSQLKSESIEYLSKAQQKSEDVASQWDQDNQQWWNWYMTLADNKNDKNSFGAKPRRFREQESIEIDAAQLALINNALSMPYELPSDAIDKFARDGYIKLKQVVSPNHLKLLRSRLGAILINALGAESDLAFRSDEMMWLHDELVSHFVMSNRVAKIASELLRVQAVRLYHDNALSKEPGCGRTPWHYDYHHFPIDSLNVCTAWIPLQDIPKEMGPLSFAAGINNYKLVENLAFNKFDSSYDKELGRIFADNDVPVDDGSFDLGDVSFHHTLSFHTAGANRTNESRMALATTYFEDGARLVENPTMISGDFQKFMPGIEPGGTIDSEYNPICHQCTD